ncbi:winged helix-turn-helix domain-containing protein [Altericroceibacterium xinjiangense]|uniref:winged helix-turn-helix domain-containing protein n=1 Tax=Altericroceibacterium xinjiangense TaxID=762261 RepID=UPI001F4A03CD|nr:LysR family transcriptional regulator [Altericroceibacterium xinjiangense]
MKGEGAITRLKLKLQLYCGEEIALGPGKADLLEQIGATGSISGAARSLGMSYRRAWLLVATMNRCFHEPLVQTHPGGGNKAGAELTAAGRTVLAAYRDLCESAQAAAAGEALERLESALRDPGAP